MFTSYPIEPFSNSRISKVLLTPKCPEEETWVSSKICLTLSLGTEQRVWLFHSRKIYSRKKKEKLPSYRVIRKSLKSSEG